MHKISPLHLVFSPRRIAAQFTFYLGGDDPPPAPAAPDYTEVAAANNYATDKAYQTAENKLAFDKSIYEDAKPYVKQLQENAVELGKTNTDIANTNKAAGDLQLSRYRDKGIPAEDRMYADAESYGNEADQEREAGIASNQVQAQAAGQREQAAIRLQDAGVNPNSGAAIGMQMASDLSTAAASANAANSARTTVKDKGIALRAGAANFARGGTSAAATGFSTAIGAGQASTGQYSAAANAGLPSASIVDGGYNAGMSAAQLGSQAALGMGNVLNTGYGISMNGYNAQMAANAQSDAGFGSLLGGLASAGARMYTRGV